MRFARIMICAGMLACGGGEATGPTGPTDSPAVHVGIAGTWTLRSIGKFNLSQQPLPFTDGDEVFLTAVITANSDGTFTDETTRRLTINGQVTTTTRKWSGTWTRTDSALYRLRYPHMATGDYIVTLVSGTNLFYHNIPNTWVFTRNVPAGGLANQGSGQPFRGCAFVKTVSRGSTVQGSLDAGDCKLASSGFYAEHIVDYYELRLDSPATFAIEELSTEFDADWLVFDRATGEQLWHVSKKDTPERAWRRITLGAGTYIVVAKSEFKAQSGKYTLKIE